MRGLFEYIYSADGLKLIPHVPPGITELHQLDPIRFGKKKLYISYSGPGAIQAVTINGQVVKHFDPDSVELVYSEMPEAATIHVIIQCGGNSGRDGSNAGGGGGGASDRPAGRTPIRNWRQRFRSG